jgi:transcription initiation factor IIF auxiliary subunit
MLEINGFMHVPILDNQIKNLDAKYLINQTRDMSILQFNKNEFEDAIIKKVIFKLHPNFHPPVVEVINWPFEVTRIGWGTFNVEITIEFQDYLHLEKMIIDHNLNFDDEICSSSKIIPIDFNKR